MLSGIIYIFLKLFLNVVIGPYCLLLNNFNKLITNNNLKRHNTSIHV